MPTPVTGVTGPSGERSTASADIIAEARQRQADRQRAARAETTKPAEVVERAQKTTGTTDATEAEAKRATRPYRVNLDPDTRRLYTEVLDTATGEVIMRIPAGYGAETDAADESPAIPRSGEKTGEVEA
ncbi:flagellar protein FlaG (plasmid) [Azospirillum oryzae]|uniref:Flagellar protein FlaG n=1 Tax=Azospirillum oryzae TaxID=286727 RepID=A0A6N1AQB0_9PROT|nr:flagellar protein FlaG [Azospirillum oryzae]KAA0586440.1 flagellar protein FlaG [Azospirillum oryzae]QKS53498.1 flagellar protein FlaG [Azospirillum oryzae]GLR80389.1 hypothetical protein GCM10007856_30670 [Azospirillum oryzae]